jgi:hypothetical protein
MTERPPRSSRSRLTVWVSRVVLAVCAVGLIFVVANWPVSTRQGIDFEVSTIELPLYVKALDFIQRDAGYRQLASRIVPADSTAEARALALFAWTREHIRDVPPSLPVVDDHVLHIVIRGYGTDDQKADVFATLATYAGVRAYWALIGEAPKLALSFAQVDGRWRVFDVANGIVFHTSGGELATPDELTATPSLVQEAAGQRLYLGRPYMSYFTGFRFPEPPDVLRAEQQMLGPRLRAWVKQLVIQ